MIKKTTLIITILFNIYALNSYAGEIKIGLMQHDATEKMKNRYEKGKNIIVEYLFDQEYFKARPHIGLSANTLGYTSNLYTGLTWQMIFKDHFLLEASLGASINNGERTQKEKKRRALGSNLLFRESLSLGWMFDKHHSISVMIDHISNANIKMPNPGLTDVGIRYGYRF